MTYDVVWGWLRVPVDPWAGWNTWTDPGFAWFG